MTSAQNQRLDRDPAFGLPHSAQRTRGFDVDKYLDKAFRKEPSDPLSPLDLLSWGRRYLPHYFKSPPSKMHRWMAERFEAAERERGARLNIVGPRGGAKSTVGTLAWVLRCLVEGSEPYVWIVGDTRLQAQMHLENLKRELEDNAALTRDYPQACGRGRVWRAARIELRSGVVCEAAGTGVRLRGRRRRAERPTLIVCDDLQNDAHIESARARALASRWFHGTLLKAGTRRTNVVNLATALHRDALAMELGRTPGWTSRTFAALVTPPERMDLWDEWERIYANSADQAAGAAARRFYDEHRAAMEAGAELLWPEEESLYDLMCGRAESGRAVFEREKQGVPLNPELCEWPEDYFAGEDIWFAHWPERLLVRTLAVDPSKGRDARRGDYSALVRLGIDAAGLLYVEADLARRPTPEIVAAAFDGLEEFRPDALGVEANHFQELIGDELVREAQRRGRHDFAPWTLTNTAPKPVRIRRLGPLLARRRIRFLLGSPGTRLLVNQLRDFPCGDHDDGPDALEMAYRLAQELLAGATTVQ
jgi:predicted phage terminase large subunit-like protein